jgi:hypothetical protein
MPALASAPPTAAISNVTPLPHDTAALARIAIADLVAFWAELPVDPIGPTQARRELLAAVPGLRRLAEAIGA